MIPARHRPLLALVALVTLTLATAPTVAQATLHPRYEVGQRTTYDLDLTIRETTDGVDGVAPSERRQTLRLRTNILGADESGAASATIVAERVAILSGGETVSRTEPADDAALPKATNDLERAANAIAGHVLRVDLTPDGRVDAVYGLETVGAVFGEKGISRAQRLTLGAFDATISASILSTLWHLDQTMVDGEPIERSIGESWQNTWSARVGGSVRLNGATDYTLEAVTGDVAEVVGLPTLEAERIATADEPGTIAPRVDATITDGQIKARWSLTDGQLLERSSTETRRISVSLPGLEPVVRTAETTIEIRRVDQPDEDS